MISTDIEFFNLRALDFQGFDRADKASPQLSEHCFLLLAKSFPDVLHRLWDAPEFIARGAVVNGHSQ